MLHRCFQKSFFFHYHGFRHCGFKVGFVVGRTDGYAFRGFFVGCGVGKCGVPVDDFAVGFIVDGTIGLHDGVEDGSAVLRTFEGLRVGSFVG